MNDGRDRSTGAKAMGAPAKRRPVWLIPLILGILGVLLLLLLLSQCGGDDDAEDTATSGVGTTATATVPRTASATTSDGSGADAAGTAAGTVTADGTPLLPLAESSQVGADGDLSAYDGHVASATSVRVQSVPTDEGFWVGSSETDRVWVQLTGLAGESPFTVKEGDNVAFTGAVTKARDGYPEEIGLTDAEGGPMLAQQGQYISVKKSDMKLAY